MKQVLVVDDSPVIRKIARRILEGMRLQTSEAADGKQALAACSFLMPDAILLDWSMPVLDGFGFLKQLRRMPGGDQIEAEDLEKSGLITYPFGSLYILDSVQTGVQKFSQFSGAVRCVFEVGISWVPIKGMQNREAYSNCVEDAVFAVINGLANQNWGAPLVYNGGIQCRRGQTKFGGMNFRKVVAFPMLFELHQ